VDQFVGKYGPWAVVLGASEGAGALFAESLADRGLNVVLVSRRQNVIDGVAARIRERTGVQTKTLAVDLSEPDAAQVVIAATAELSIGMVVFYAGGDPGYTRFLAAPVEAGEALLQRNCLVLMRLCHHFAQPMVERGSGGIVIFGSGAGFAGGPNMVAYAATKAFDMVFAEALWSEVHDKGVDVLGVILGMTDTPSLRRLEYRRGRLESMDQTPEGAGAPEVVVAEAFDNLANGPILIATDQLRFAEQFLRSVSRNEAVRLVMQAGAESMASDREDL
jgi:short-subunit dehydrogenase